MIEPIPLFVLTVTISVVGVVLWVRDLVERYYGQEERHDDC